MTTKRYPLNQSPFFRLQSRAKLAALLHVPPAELEKMAAAQDSLYNCFSKKIEKNGKIKERRVERPKPELRRVQKRFVQLLDRIQPPDYLHSGVRERSYISNASRHDPNVKVAKIDIRNFFPSAYAGHVYRSFVDEFQCSHDVAAVVMRLTTAFGHLPTGGNSSTMISFFAFKKMFDEINSLAASHGLVMSCCVDDMTFSGTKATMSFLNKVRVIVQRFDLKTHKRHCFEPHQTKIVTGVALTPQGIRLPNARRKKLHEAFGSYEKEIDQKKRIKLGEQLLGRATEAAQVESQFSSLVPIAAGKMAEAKKAMRIARSRTFERRFVPSKSEFVPIAVKAPIHDPEGIGPTGSHIAPPSQYLRNQSDA